MAKLLDEKKIYIAQAKRAHVRDIIRNLQNYTCQLVTQESSPSYLQFEEKNTNEILRFQLGNFAPIRKITYFFTEEPSSVEIGERVTQKAPLFKDQKSKKRPRQFTEEYPEDSSSQEKIVFNEDIKDKPRYKGVESHDEDVKKRARNRILEILQSEPDGNITPSAVRQRLKDDYNDEQTQKFVRLTMERLCEPSQKNDRKFILLKEFQLSQQDGQRKKRKTE